MKISLMCAALLLLAGNAGADVQGYLMRRSGDDAFYVDTRHRKGVEAIWKGDWTKAVDELESCLSFYLNAARNGDLYRDSARSQTVPDSIVMYDPKYNSVRYALAVANAHAAAAALEIQKIDAGDSLASRALYFWQHVLSVSGSDVVTAFSHLGHANMERGRPAIAESFARKAVNCADRGLPSDDPVRGAAYLRLGEVYLAASKIYDAESPLMIATDIADTGAVRKGDAQQLCREMAVEGRCLLAACYRRMGQSAQADSLDLMALAQLESVKKPLNLPQADSLLDQFIDAVRLSDHADQAPALADRLAKVRARREGEYPQK